MGYTMAVGSKNSSSTLLGQNRNIFKLEHQENINSLNSNFDVEERVGFVLCRFQSL